MTRTIGKLSAIRVANLKEPGMYGDGGGLWLQVSKHSTEPDAPPGKSWVFRYTLNKRTRAMGLGSFTAVSLAEARDAASRCRKLCAAGIDPIEATKAERSKAAKEAASAITFKECAARHIADHKAGWRNVKHAAQWESTLRDYAYPVLGGLRVNAIDTQLILRVIQPIWTTKTETAKRLRGRIEAILDRAKVLGFRQGENPAQLRGHLDKLLPAPAKVRKVKHHAALPYAELSKFMRKLRQQEGVAARALEFLILTGARTGEVIGARKPEIKRDTATWIVPGERMKAGVEHRVPLTDRALELIEQTSGTESEFVFPGRDLKHPLSNMAMAAVLRRMGYDHITVHGFRSTFRDWTAEQTSYSGEVAEAALAHANGDKVEAAYLRADLFEKRRRLMNDWDEYCRSDRTAKAQVVPIRATVA